MHAACPEVSPTASPASNNGCRRPLLAPVFLRLAAADYCGPLLCQVFLRLEAADHLRPLLGQVFLRLSGRYCAKYFCGWRRRTMSGRYCAKYFCGGPFQVAIGKWLGPDDGAASALLPAQRPPSYPIRKSGAAPSLSATVAPSSIH